MHRAAWPRSRPARSARLLPHAAEELGDRALLHERAQAAEREHERRQRHARAPVVELAERHPDELRDRREAEVGTSIWRFAFVKVAAITVNA